MALAAAGFLVVFLLRLATDDAANGVGLLFILPIAMVAWRFGVRGGLAGAAVATALFAVYMAVEEPGVGVLGLAIRALNFLLVGVLVGRIAESGREAYSELHDAWRMTRDVFDNAPCGFHSLDADGRLVEVNQTEARWLKASREDLLGRPFAEIITPASVRVFEERFPVFKATGTVVDVPLVLVAADGSEVPVLLSATAVRDADGRFLSSRSVLLDQREREALRSELERQNGELRQFADVVSHDLQGPLTTARGFLELLRSPRADTPARREEHLAHVEATLAGMQALVDALLEYTGSGQADLRSEPVALGEAAARAVADLGRQIERAGAEVEVGPLPTVLGDPALLTTVLRNLVANAVKYVAPGERPRVAVTARPDPACAIIEVRDNGIGFGSEAEARDAFEPMTRLASAEGYGGTGLGLAIVTRIVERHGGSISVESPRGGGSAVLVRLPLG